MGIASDRMGKIYRKEWTRYKELGFPTEDKAVEFASSEDTVNNALVRTDAYFDQGFANAEGALGRNMSRWGLNESARARSGRVRTTAADNTAARVVGLNKTRTRIKDLQNEMRAGDVAPGLDKDRMAV